MEEQTTPTTAPQPEPSKEPQWKVALIRTRDHNTLTMAIDKRGRSVYDVVHVRVPDEFGPRHIVAVVLAEPRDGMVGPLLSVWVAQTRMSGTGPAVGLSGYDKAWGRNTSVERCLRRVHNLWNTPDFQLPSTLWGKTLRQLVVVRALKNLEDRDGAAS